MMTREEREAVYLAALRDIEKRFNTELYFLKLWHSSHIPVDKVKKIMQEVIEVQRNYA